MFKKGQLVRSRVSGKCYVVADLPRRLIAVSNGHDVYMTEYSWGARMVLIGNNYKVKPCDK